MSIYSASAIFGLIMGFILIVMRPAIHIGYAMAEGLHSPMAFQTVIALSNLCGQVGAVMIAAAFCIAVLRFIFLLSQEAKEDSPNRKEPT